MDGAGDDAERVAAGRRRTERALILAVSHEVHRRIQKKKRSTSGGEGDCTDAGAGAATDGCGGLLKDEKSPKSSSLSCAAAPTAKDPQPLPLFFIERKLGLVFYVWPRATKSVLAVRTRLRGGRPRHRGRRRGRRGSDKVVKVVFHCSGYQTAYTSSKIQSLRMSSSQPRQQPRQAQQQQAQAQAQAQQQDMMLQELTRMREQLELLQLQVNQNNPVVAPAPAPAPVPPQPTVSLAGKKNVRASATSVISAAPATSSSSGADASATSNAAKLKAQKLDTRIEQGTFRITTGSHGGSLQR